MLDLLPEEIIFEIFNLLPAHCLIALTETCKLFNEIISESFHLTEKFELYFVPENKILKWNGYRKYSRVYLEGSVANFYREIFIDISANLKELQVICLSMEATNLKEILLNCTNLRKILIKDNKINYKSEDFDDPLPKLTLQSLHYRNFTLRSTKLFKILQNCQVHDLKIVGFLSTCDDLLMFIKKQTGLQSFALQDVDKNSSFFSTEILNSVDFRLNKLAIDKYTNDIAGLEAFLKNHQSTLRHLELNEVKQEILKYLENFPKIKKMQIFEMFFRKEFPTVMSSVENLTIGYDVSGNWAENFPNLRQLKVTWIRLKRDLTQIEQLKNLKNLEIEYCCMPELEIPTVKTLILSEVGFINERPFKLENNQIEKLFIYHCTHCEWLIEFLEFHSKSLKNLRIKETNMSCECWEVIKKCSNNFVLQILN